MTLRLTPITFAVEVVPWRKKGSRLAEHTMRVLKLSSQTITLDHPPS